MAEALAKLSAGATFINAVVSVILVGFLYNAVRPALIKMQVLQNKAKRSVKENRILRVDRVLQSIQDGNALQHPFI